MPCSTSLGGNAELLIIYGFMLLKAAQLLSDGSELPLTVMSPDIIGGLVLPILGAFPTHCSSPVWKISFERFLQFLKSSQALSPGVTLETAAVLQNKVEEVTRRALEQLQQALEQQSRFSIDLDLNAPKIKIKLARARKTIHNSS